MQKMTVTSQYHDCDVPGGMIWTAIFIRAQRVMVISAIIAFGGSQCGADDLSKSAQGYSQAKAYKVELPLREELSRQDPNSVQKLCDLSMCLMRTRKMGRAEALLRKALAINPKSAPASYLLALIYSRNAQYEAALSAIEVSVTTDPSYPAYRLLKARLYVLIENVAAARAVLATVDDAVPQKEDELATLKIFDGDFEGGKKALLEIVAKDPNDIGTKFEYATTIVHCEAARADERQRAVQFMEDVIAKSDTTPLEIAPDCLLYFILANAHAGVGNSDLATIFQRKALSLYETRCGVEKSELERAARLFSENKRFFPKRRRGLPFP